MKLLIILLLLYQLPLSAQNEYIANVDASTDVHLCIIDNKYSISIVTEDSDDQVSELKYSFGKVKFMQDTLFLIDDLRNSKIVMTQLNDSLFVKMGLCFLKSKIFILNKSFKTISDSILISDHFQTNIKNGIYPIDYHYEIEINNGIFSLYWNWKQIVVGKYTQIGDIITFWSESGILFFATINTELITFKMIPGYEHKNITFKI